MRSERAALYLAYPFYLFADARTVRLKRFLFIEEFVRYRIKGGTLFDIFVERNTEV